MAYWKFFKESDIIDAISPGYPSPAHEVEGSRQFLLKWKLTPRIPKNLIKPHFLHSNEDGPRFEFLKQALQAKDSRVIWCLRGGYGSNRLLPMLAKLKKPKDVKLLIGLSDVTSLQTFIIQEWGWPVFHSPILDRLGRGDIPPRDEKELHRIFFGQQTVVEFKKLKPLNEAARKVRNLKSKIVGGNLTTLQSTMGTPWQINADKKLLFLEDWGERGYRIDRMLEQFRQGGVLKKCHGILLGDFLGGAEPATGKNNFNKVFKRWADDLDIPVFSGLEAGHGKIQRPIPFNTPCVLNVESGRGYLTIQTGGRP